MDKQYMSFSPYCHFELDDQASCLYVLNSKEMFQIDSNLNKLIEEIIKNKYIGRYLNSAETEFLESLTEMKLLSFSDNPVYSFDFFDSGFNKRGYIYDRLLQYSTMNLRFDTKPGEIDDFPSLIHQFINLGGNSVIFDLSPGLFPDDFEKYYFDIKQFDSLKKKIYLRQPQLEEFKRNFELEFDELIISISDPYISSKEIQIGNCETSVIFQYELNEDNQAEMLKFIFQNGIQIFNINLNYSSIDKISLEGLQYLKKVENKLMRFPSNFLGMNEAINIDSYSTIFLSNSGNLYTNKNYTTKYGNVLVNPLYRAIQAEELLKHKNISKREFSSCQKCPFRFGCYYSISNHELFYDVDNRDVILCERDS